MKSEKEFAWLVKLLDSPFLKTINPLKKQEAACKADLERYVGTSENDKVFRAFLKDLIAQGYIERFEHRKVIGGSTDFYVVNSRIRELLRKHRLYPSVRRVVIKNDSALGF